MPSMSIFRRTLIGVIVPGLVVLAPPAVLVGGPAAAEKLVEDWKSYAPGRVGLPGEWTFYRGFPAPKHLPVVITDAGRPALRLKTEHSSIRMMLKVDVDLTKTPVLRWDWKAVTLPRLGNAQSAVNDQVARLFLIFGSALRARGLGYIWDTAAPVSTVTTTTQTLLDRRLLVVRSGSAGVGAWQTETRNVLDDYTKLFGSAPGHVRAVGIESHSEDANHTSEALFGSLSFTSAR